MKKSFRLLSTILAAVIILTSVAIGFSVFADGLDDLTNPNRPYLVSMKIECTSGHNLTANPVGYGIFDYNDDNPAYGGFNGTISLTAADILLTDGKAPSWSWGPHEGYTWTINGETFSGKTVSIKTEPGKSYDVNLSAVDIDNDNTLFTVDAGTLTFSVPESNPADSPERAELEMAINMSSAASKFGYKDEYWKPFERSRTNAGLVKGNMSATTEDVVNATKLLNDTFKDLNSKSSKLSGIDQFFLMIWEGLRYMLWDQFLGKIFSFI